MRSTPSTSRRWENSPSTKPGAIQWHQGVIDGTHYNGLDGEKYAPENVVPFLHSAAIALGEAYGAIGSAHSINSGVRWYETAKESENV